MEERFTADGIAGSLDETRADPASRKIKIPFGVVLAQLESDLHTPSHLGRGVNVGYLLSRER